MGAHGWPKNFNEIKLCAVILIKSVFSYFSGECRMKLQLYFWNASIHQSTLYFSNLMTHCIMFSVGCGKMANLLQIVCFIRHQQLLMYMLKYTFQNAVDFCFYHRSHRQSNYGPVITFVRRDLRTLNTGNRNRFIVGIFQKLLEWHGIIKIPQNEMRFKR